MLLRVCVHQMILIASTTMLSRSMHSMTQLVIAVVAAHLAPIVALHCNRYLAHAKVHKFTSLSAA